MVDDGDGGGNYPEGHQVTIEADRPPSGMKFDQWIIQSGNPTIADMNASSTTLTMGDGPAMVSASYTEGVAVENKFFGENAFRVYPNPAQHEITIDIEMKQADAIDITLRDLSGRVVGRSFTDRTLQPGRTVLKLPLTGITPGTYILSAGIARNRYAKLMIIE